LIVITLNNKQSIACIYSDQVIHHRWMKLLPTVLLCLLCVGFLVSTESRAQAPVKPARAVAYSLLLPGLGHKYINEGSWNRTATLYTVVDVALMVGLVSSEWQRRYLVNSYQTWASSYAGISTEGKDRSFYLTIGNHLSSDAYRDAQLRERRVDLAARVNDPEFQWSWNSIEDFQRYRDLRGSSESWSQRRGSLIVALVANRLIAAVTALIAARRQQDQVIEVAVTPDSMIRIALTL